MTADLRREEIARNPDSLEIYLAQRTDVPNRDSILFAHRQDIAA